MSRAVEALDHHRPFFEVLDVALEWEQATNRRRSGVGYYQIDLREALSHQLFQTLLESKALPSDVRQFYEPFSLFRSNQSVVR